MKIRIKTKEELEDIVEDHYEWEDLYEKEFEANLIEDGIFVNWYRTQDNEMIFAPNEIDVIEG